MAAAGDAVRPARRRLPSLRAAEVAVLARDAHAGVGEAGAGRHAVGSDVVGELVVAALGAAVGIGAGRWIC